MAHRSNQKPPTTLTLYGVPVRIASVFDLAGMLWDRGLARTTRTLRRERDATACPG